MRAGGIFPAIIGTVYLVFISLAFALPIGVMAAIYLTEYAKDNLLTRIINLAIINLAGVSSVVFGLFGLSLFVVFLKFGVSIISGALTLGIMALPVIITTTREALRSVPDAYREVSFSLGASRWQTVRHAVLPRALSGILTGAILSVGRVAGETAPILFTVAPSTCPTSRRACPTRRWPLPSLRHYHPDPGHPRKLPLWNGPRPDRDRPDHERHRDRRPVKSLEEEMSAPAGTVKVKVRGLSVSYGAVAALKGLDLDIASGEILSIIGPSNSGKTSFLRSLNRMNELNPRARTAGTVLLDGADIVRDMSAEALRKRIGMIFAMPVPLPLSIRDNITYGPRMAGVRDAAILDGLIEESLRAAYLWEEVKDRLNMSGQKLSGGQQQRLCIARTLALKPDVILYDEPCSGLDPISTAKVEESMLSLRKSHTLVLVTNNTKQAARVGTRTAFFLMGEMIEVGPTSRLFTAPADKRTEDYIIGRFG